MIYNNLDLHELNANASPWAFDLNQLKDRCDPIETAGLKAFLIAVLCDLCIISESEAQEIVENETAFCCSGLWVVGGRYYSDILKYNGFYIKGVKLTKNNTPLVEIWNDAEEVRTFRG